MYKIRCPSQFLPRCSNASAPGIDMCWQSVTQSLKGCPSFTVGHHVTGRLSPGGGSRMGAPKFYDTRHFANSIARMQREGLLGTAWKGENFSCFVQLYFRLYIVLDCLRCTLKTKTGNFQGDHAPRPPYNHIANHILYVRMQSPLCAPYPGSSPAMFFLAGEEPGLASFPGAEKGRGKRSTWYLLYAHVH